MASSPRRFILSPPAIYINYKINIALLSKIILYSLRNKYGCDKMIIFFLCFQQIVPCK
jgi:hypothetical protein